MDTAQQEAFRLLFKAKILKSANAASLEGHPAQSDFTLNLRDFRVA